MPEHITAEIADKLIPIAKKQLLTSSNFKKERMKDIKVSEEFYYGKKRKTLKGRFVVALPVMSGFVDTLLSKIDDPPLVKFGYTDLADYKRALKVSAAWEQDSAPKKGNWPLIDRMGKKLNIFSGRTINKYYAESEPKYESNFTIVDHNNFHCEPKGGAVLKNHAFMGEENIWKSESDLMEGAKTDFYSMRQVRKLLQAQSTVEEKENESIYQDSIQRYSSLGLDMQTNTYVGVPTVRLVEWYMIYEGKWYYILFDYKSGVWVRAHLLKDIFKNDEPPYVSWAAYPDNGNFWSKAPADDARPIADIMDVLASQMLNNRMRINSAMRGFDPEMIPDPTQLKYRPDGLVEIKRRTENGSIKDGVYEFTTDKLDGSIDLLEFFRGTLGRDTGITASTQGSAEEDSKVGIYFGNLQQVADRLGLLNKSYKESYAELGLKYFYGLQEHLTEPMAVKMIGSLGVEPDDLTKEDLTPSNEFDITISGGRTEEQANEVKKREQRDTLTVITGNPLLLQETNVRQIAEKTLANSFEEADVKLMMDKDNAGNIEIISEAEQAVQAILKGDNPPLNRQANTSFMQYIIDFATDDIQFGIKGESEKKEIQKREWFEKLMSYAQAHWEIAVENMQRKLNLTPQPQQPAPPGQLPVGEGKSVDEPLPSSPGSTLSKSGEISNVLSGQAPTL